MLFLNVREVHKLGNPKHTEVLENRLPKIMYGAAIEEEVGGWRKLQSETSYLAPFIYYYYYCCCCYGNYIN